MHIFTVIGAFLLSISLSFELKEHHVISPSGTHQIPISLLRQHFPSKTTHPTHLLSNYVFEHTIATDHILSNNEVLHAPTLSPNRTQPPPAHRYLVNNEPLNPPHKEGPIIRMGKHYVFVYDYESGILLGAWGPKLYLKPLNFKTHPSLFVNIHYEEHKTTSNSINTLKVTNRQSDDKFDKLGHFRPRWLKERSIFFDMGIAFDYSFCSTYGTDPRNASQISHATGVVAHQMTLTPIVSVRIGDVVGFCKTSQEFSNSPTPLKDVFGPPSEQSLQSCRSDPSCSPADLRLFKFREAWKSYVNDSLNDAAYLLTASTSLKKNDIVGAAWVASACSDFGYGWVMGNHPVVLAHELGHTLGAPHSTNGLMRPFLSLSETTNYTGRSLNSIENFIGRVSGQNCFRARTQGTDGNRVFTGFTRLLRPQTDGGLLQGTDIATGEVREHGEVLVTMLSTFRSKIGVVGAKLRICKLSRGSEKGFPFIYKYSTFEKYVATSFALSFGAGAGVAIASLVDDSSDDVIPVMFNANKKQFYYVIGYGLEDSKSIISNGWSSSRRIPKNIENDVIAMGAAAGDMRGKGQSDLIVSYIERDVAKSKISAKYFIGFNLKGERKNPIAAGGWSSSIELPISQFIPSSTTVRDIGDISAAIWFRPSTKVDVPSTTSLLFSIMARNPVEKNWFTISCAANHAQSFTVMKSQPAGSITCFKANVRLAQTDHLTGGIALTRLLSATSPVATSVIFQNRRFDNNATSQWLAVGDGLLTKERAVSPAQPEQLALSIGEDIIPQDTCSRCYAQNQVKTCEQKLRSCFARREFGKLEKVRVQSLVRAGSTNVNIKPNSDTIFCAGFHSIFVLQQNSQDSKNLKCGWDSKRTSIISEGVRVILLDLVSKRQPSTGSVKTTNSKIPENLRYIIEYGNGLGSGFVPKSVSVTVISAKFLRFWIINQALNKIKKRSDFNSFFSNSKKKAKIKKVGKKKYIVRVEFRVEYQTAYLKDIVSGRSHD